MDEEQGCKLFIYGVDQNTIIGDLQAEFEKFGKVIYMNNTGKGFTFVTFNQKEDDSCAIWKNDMAIVNGQQIKGNEAKHRGEDGGG